MRPATYLTAALSLLAVTLLLCGCLNEEKNGPEVVKITISGSTTVLPIAQGCKDAYTVQHRNVEISINGGGSGVGISDVTKGISDIGMSSRELKDKERTDYPNLNVVVIGKDGIAIIVNKANPATGLTIEQVGKIFSGEITDWSQLGFAPARIVPVGRDKQSGTRVSFDELVMHGKNVTMNMLEKSSTGEVFDSVKTNTSAIGYIGMGYLNNEVKGLKIDGISPSVVTVQDDEYPISRSLNFVTLGEPKGEVKRFIDFVRSVEGQEIVEEAGYVPLK